jgi:hypothetical protein
VWGLVEWFPPPRLSGRSAYSEQTFAGTHGNVRGAPTAAIPAIVKRGPDPKRTLDTGSAGLAIGGAYLAVAAGVDHLVAEFGVAR